MPIETSQKRLLKIFFHCLSLWTIQGIKSALGQRSASEEIDGAVVGAMRRQRSGPGLVEYRAEIMDSTVTPVRSVGCTCGIQETETGEEARPRPDA